MAMNIDLVLNKILALFISMLLLAQAASAQTSSMGPGKGPPTPGSGKSKYTYPQPPKTVAVPPSSMRPGSQVPEFPERYIWKLTGKMYGMMSNKANEDISVYSFSSGQRSLVGQAKAGEEITLDEFRPVGRSLFYRFDWKGSTAKPQNGPAPEYWVHGGNIEFAGVR